MRVELSGLIPAQFEAWTVVFALAEAFDEGWVVVGGQMIQLHATELGVGQGVRPTFDIDVLVDIRAHRSGTERVADWLIEQGFELEGVNAFGIGHRYWRAADPGPGKVIVDVLAPDGVGENASRLTSPPARTVLVPGGTQALDRAEAVNVVARDLAGDRSVEGIARRPSLLGALVTKAAATAIPGRENPDRDWQDAALLLRSIPDPFVLVSLLDRKDRDRLRRLRALDDRGHPGWALLGDEDHRRGTTALGILLDTK